MNKRKNKSKNKIRNKSKNNLINESKNKHKELHESIRSKKLLKDILLYIPIEKRFEIIKINKSIMKKCGYNKSKEIIKELINKTSINDLLSEKYITRYFIEREDDDENIKEEDYYDIMICKVIKEKKISLNYNNFFAFLETIDYRKFRIEKINNFPKNFFQNNDKNFYTSYKEYYNNLVLKYFNCLDNLLKSMTQRDEFYINLIFEININKGIIQFEGKYFQIEKYDEFLQKYCSKIKSISINGLLSISDNDQDQNNINNLLEKLLKKNKNLQTINIRNNINIFNKLAKHNSFRTLEILYIEDEGDSTNEKIKNIYDFISNNLSIKLLIIKNVNLFLNFFNKFKIDNSIKIILIITYNTLHCLDHLGKNILNDLFIYIYSVKFNFFIMYGSLNSFKVLKFHCKKKLLIKHGQFNLTIDDSSQKNIEQVTNFLKENDMEYKIENDEDKIVEEKINEFENNLKSNCLNTYEYNDQNRNSVRLVYPFDKLTEENKKNIKEFKAEFYFKSYISKMLKNMKDMTNLIKFHLIIHEKYDWFLAEYRNVIRFWNNLEECSITFRGFNSNIHNNIYSKKVILNTEKGQFIRDILKGCQKLKYLDINKCWFEKEDDEGCIRKLIKRKNNNKFSKNLQNIIIRYSVIDIDNVKEQIVQINKELYQDMINGYPKIICYVCDPCNQYIKSDELPENVSELII